MTNLILIRYLNGCNSLLLKQSAIFFSRYYYFSVNLKSFRYKSLEIIRFDIHMCRYLYERFALGFPMGRESAIFWDKGTKIPSLSRNKGTTGQAQNLATGREGPGQPFKIQDRTRDGTITIFLSKSGTGHGTGRDGPTLFFFFYDFLF